MSVSRSLRGRVKPCTVLLILPCFTATICHYQTYPCLLLIAFACFRGIGQRQPEHSRMGWTSIFLLPVKICLDVPKTLDSRCTCTCKSPLRQKTLQKAARRAKSHVVCSQTVMILVVSQVPFHHSYRTVVKYHLAVSHEPRPYQTSQVKLASKQVAITCLISLTHRCAICASCVSLSPIFAHEMRIRLCEASI